MKRNTLLVSSIYIESLEEVLEIALDDDSLKRKVVRKQIEAIADSVASLSLGLTKQGDTSLDRRYLEHKEYQTAYQLYYTTTNLLKVIPPLRELAFSGFAETDELRVLDLGTGTGAAVWGLVQYLETEHAKPIRLIVTAVDSVRENLKFVRHFATALAKRCTHVELRVETKLLDLEDTVATARMLTTGAFDLVLLMNVFNELTTSAQNELLAVVPKAISAEGNFIIIEPASKAHSRKLLQARDKMVDSGLTIYAPCTRAEHCPALISDDDWCHSEYRWVRPRFIEMIDEQVGFVKLSLKSSYLSINNRGVTLRSVLGITDEIFRVVSQRFDEKGRVRAICCGVPGRNEFVMNKRDKSMGNKQFIDIERYDLIEISGTIIREHDVQISGASEINSVLQSTGAR